MIGFSVPDGDEILVISYEGVHLLRLGNKITVQTDDEFTEYKIYDPDTGVARYQGKSYQIIGLHGGRPILESPAGETLMLDTGAKTLSIVKDGQTAFTMEYSNFSGDWAAATFSTDGRRIVAGCPSDFDFVILEREDAI
jgi:hypothetical protein